MGSNKMKKYKVKNNRFFHLSLILIICISLIFLIFSPNYQTMRQISESKINKSIILFGENNNIKLFNDNLSRYTINFTSAIEDPNMLNNPLEPVGKGVIPSGSKSVSDICSALVDGADYLKYAQEQLLIFLKHVLSILLPCILLTLLDQPFY